MLWFEGEGLCWGEEEEGEEEDRRLVEEGARVRSESREGRRKGLEDFLVRGRGRSGRMESVVEGKAGPLVHAGRPLEREGVTGRVRTALVVLIVVFEVEGGGGGGDGLRLGGSLLRRKRGRQRSFRIVPAA